MHHHVLTRASCVPVAALRGTPHPEEKKSVKMIQDTFGEYYTKPTQLSASLEVSFWGKKALTLRSTLKKAQLPWRNWLRSVEVDTMFSATRKKIRVTRLARCKQRLMRWFTKMKVVYTPRPCMKEQRYEIHLNLTLSIMSLYLRCIIIMCLLPSETKGFLLFWVNWGGSCKLWIRYVIMRQNYII